MLFYIQSDIVADIASSVQRLYLKKKNCQTAVRRPRVINETAVHSKQSKQ